MNLPGNNDTIGKLLIWFEHWLTGSILIVDNLFQLGVILMSFAIAFWIGRPLAAKHRQWRISKGTPLISGTLPNALNALILHLTLFLLLCIYFVTAKNFGWPDSIIRIVISLLSAWIIIRLTATLIRADFWRITVAILAWSVAALNILGLLKPALMLLDSTAFQIGNLNISLLTLVKGFVYLVIFLWLANLVSNFIQQQLRKSSSLTPSAAVLTSKLIHITLVTAAFLMAISTVGIDLTLFAVFGGALGVGLGFGLQKVVSNFISGIILLLDKSIKPGDVISIGDTYGWVKSLNARYVSLDTRDGIEHLIPNEELITTRVENWSYSNNRIRLKIPVGVHYQSDVKKSIELCLEAADDTDRILETPKPVCLLTGFGDSSVDLEIRLWINDPQNGISNVKSEVLLKVWDKFHQHGIEIPYPQRDLHIKSPIDIKQG